MNNVKPPKKKNPWWYLLAVIPLIGTLFPSFYSSDNPELWGIPFFFWYQMLWVIISVAITGIMYNRLKDE